MADFDYSIEALNAKSAFYRSTAIVYVEGDDDVLFWEELFNRDPSIAVTVESVGGSGELDKYITHIQAGELEAIAARDADHLRYQGLAIDTARVIYTFGYSMENSVYTADVIHHVTRSWCKSPSLTNVECAKWLDEIGSAFAPLIELDIANAIGNVGAAVLADNCTRFMKGQTSASPCKTRIFEHAAGVASKIPKRALIAARKELSSLSGALTDNLRGHLLATAVVKFVLQTAKVLGKKITVSMDSLYATAISDFARVFGPSHPHHSYYTEAIGAAATSFR